MTKVSYEVTTPVGSTVVKTLQRAMEIIAEKGGSYKTRYEKVVEKSHMTSIRQAWLKKKWGKA